MDSKVILPATVCEDDIIGYIASRYAATPADIIRSYMRQEGIICPGNDCPPTSYRLEENEMEILRDMGLRPDSVEFTRK